MRWFLGVAIVIVTALVVAHRINDQQVHRARHTDPALGTPQAPIQRPAIAQPIRPTTPLRVNLIGEPEYTSMVLLIPANGGRRVPPTNVDSDGFRSFDVEPGRYQLTLPGGIVLRDVRVPSPPVTIDLRGAEWTDFSVLLPVGFRLKAPIQILISGDGVLEGSRILQTRRIVHPRNRTLRFGLSSDQLTAPPLVRASAGLVRLEAYAAASITFGLPPGETPVVYRIGKDGLTSLQTHRRGNLVRVFTLRQPQDLIVHVSDHAPLVLRDVVFGDAERDCGDLEPDKGATFEFTVGEDHVFYFCSAHWLDHDLPLSNGSVDEELGFAILRGIPTGKIRVEFKRGVNTWSREYESTGKGTRRIKAPSPK